MNESGRKSRAADRKTGQPALFTMKVAGLGGQLTPAPADLALDALFVK
jgi:hypothetical protein